MLRQKYPDDATLASGNGHAARELAEIAFEHIGLATGGTTSASIPNSSASPEATASPAIGDRCSACPQADLIGRSCRVT
jgi:hypothetical protein